jgi:predicted nucleic-acid-binding Zn-ribbon protein
MTPEETQKVVQHLTTTWSGRPCPYCGTAQWIVPETIFQLTEFHPNSVVIGGPVVPVIPITCKRCGNTPLVNALTVGIIEPSPKKEEVSNG